MATIKQVQDAGALVTQAARNLEANNNAQTQEALRTNGESLNNLVRSIPTGTEVGATADKLFRQSNLLLRSVDEAVNTAAAGGDYAQYIKRVDTGVTNVLKTALQLIEESQ